MAGPALAAATVSVQVLGLDAPGGGPPPPGGTRVNARVPATITLTVKNGKVSQAIQLPLVDGLVLNGSGANPGVHSQDFNFFVTPTQPGDYTIPAFDIRTDDGQTLHVAAIKLHAIAW
jgi:BatD DUF11 like domain